MVQLFAGIGTILAIIVMAIMIVRGAPLLAVMFTAAVIIICFGLAGVGLENLWDELTGAS